jgi:hypothetical protein
METVDGVLFAVVEARCRYLHPPASPRNTGRSSESREPLYKGPQVGLCNVKVKERAFISEAGCNIEVVLIDTEAHKALDVFHVRAGGKKLPAGLQAVLSENLLKACRG